MLEKREDNKKKILNSNRSSATLLKDIHTNTVMILEVEYD